MSAPQDDLKIAPVAELERVFRLQRAAFARERYPSLRTRRDRLARLKALVTDNETRFAAAVNRDFGGRSVHETRLAELYIVSAEIADARGNLRRWMRNERVSTPLHLLPGRARIERQPLGVVGIISPWNYPVQLALAPVVGALAAGNRVLLKPSELTPATSALLHELVAAHFNEDEFAVVPGDADIGQAFTRLPFDHLFFTGSTAVGRHVARAAADNLTPVTLELGGKSPALFAPDADLALAVPRLMSGKLLNAGQTCIAPDYALVPADRVDAFVAAVIASAAKLYPSYAANADYTAIINDRHLHRLTALVDDARAKGATIVTLNPATETPSSTSRKLLPVLIVGANDSMAVMQEEIFGPLLPIETYLSLDDAVAKINDRPHPLAFYYFGGDRTLRDKVLQQTQAGGVTVNDTLWHFAHKNLPFGGVGASGAGAYHGEASFLTFTHRKPVFVQPRLAAAKLLYPPYGKLFERVLALLKKL
jgi:coniferyl-aldehyde dehydrogenase